MQAHRIVSVSQVRRIAIGFRDQGASSAQSASPIKGSQLTVAGWNNPTPETMKGSGTWFQKEVSPEDESFFLTGDGNLIKLRCAVEFRVRDATAYLSAIVDSDAFARSAILAALRAVVARTEIDAIYTAERGEVERRVAQSAQAHLDAARSGMEIVAVRLLYVHAPDEVHDAFREVASAQEDKQRTINRAHIFAVEGVNEAKAQAATMIEQALAFKEQQILRAKGDGAGFAVKLEEYRRAPDLTKFRLQIEAIEDVLPGTRKFIQPGAGQVRELDLWLLQPPPASRSK
jgi:HflK protein